MQLQPQPAARTLHPLPTCSQAAFERAEADKASRVKAAEAEAEAKYLQGQGIARQRMAILAGLKDSVNTFQGGWAAALGCDDGGRGGRLRARQRRQLPEGTTIIAAACAPHRRAACPSLVRRPGRGCVEQRHHGAPDAHTGGARGRQL